MAASLFSQTFEESLNALNVKSYKKKEQRIEAFSKQEHPQTIPVLKALLEGDLHYKKMGKKIVIVQKVDEGYQLTDPLTGKVLETTANKATKKIKINNRLRGVLKSIIAEQGLFNKNSSVRLESVKNILKNISADDEALIRKALASEQDGTVKAILIEADAIIKTLSDDIPTKLIGIKTLEEALSAEALNRLKEITRKDDKGAYEETNQEIITAAEKSVRSIEASHEFYAFVETAYFGLSLGSVLLLAAIGLAITFGVMGVINMAHGEMVMIGAYVTFTIQQMMPNAIEYSILVAIPVAFVVSGLVGVIIERGVIRFLYGRPLETLLATFGISLILQQLVRSIYTPLNREVITPEWMSGAWEINSVLALTYNRLYIIFFALMVFFAILGVMKKSSLGLQIRAVTQNRAMARTMGIRSGWVDALTFGIGSGIAGIAGVALSQLTNVGPNLGQAYIVDSFMVVVFGGVGNLWGTLVAAFTLGEINKFLEPAAGAVLAKVLILVFIILFIQKRPRGLFPQKGRDVES